MRNEARQGDPHPDWQLIVALGGPAKTAKRLGFDAPGSVQRVGNWRRRGIPDSVKVAYPGLFMRERLGEVGGSAEPTMTDATKSTQGA